MKTILTEELIDIPEGTSLDFKSRNVTVKGPLGVLKKSFKHTGFDMVRSKDN
jgi:large subunit ribosomal protein L9e